MPINIVLVKSCFVLWAVLTIAIIIKPTQYLFGIGNLFLSAFLLRAFLTFGIFEATHLCVTWSVLFSMVVLKYHGKKESNGLAVGSVGLLFSLLFFGLIFFHAGIDKLIDPYWQKGIGFKQFLELEWVLGPALRQKLLSSNFFIFSGNYFALISEICFLPLLIVPKTRKIAFVLYAPLGLQLFWPFNIFLIGYLSAVYVLCIASFVFAKSPIIQYSNAKNIYLIPAIWIVVLIGFTFTLTAWCIKQTQNDSLTKAEYKTMGTKYSYSLSRLKGETKTVQSELSSTFSIKEIYNPYDFITNRWLRRGPVALFSGAHTVGVFGYKVEYLDSLGQKLKSISFFQENGERGDLDKEFMQLNVFQGSMYSYTDLVYSMHALDSVRFFEILQKKYNKIISPIIKYIDSKVEHQYATVCIYVRPLGNDCPLSNTNWKKFIVIKSDSLEINAVDVQLCGQARNPMLKNYHSIQ